MPQYLLKRIVKKVYTNVGELMYTNHTKDSFPVCLLGLNTLYSKELLLFLFPLYCIKISPQLFYTNVALTPYNQNHQFNWWFAQAL